MATQWADDSDIATRAVHGGHEPDPCTGAILTPIHQVTTYVQDGVGADRGYTYSRAGNPTVAALERALGSLEDAPPAVCHATGMASATALVLAHAVSGDHVVCSRVVYGGVTRLLRSVLAPLGIRSTFVDAGDPDAVARKIEPRTRLVLVESPGNPTLALADIAGVADVTRAAGVPLAVDNTFLTAALQRPLDLGADIALYSTTKFVEGHNATVGGAIVSRDEALLERLRSLTKALGIAQAPFAAWLTLRGIRTLPIRMAHHSAAALRVATWLEGRAGVSRVWYPGLDSFPQAALAARQHRAHGGVLAFEVAGGLEAARRVAGAIRLAALAESLGAVETLLTHPATMTHAEVPADARRAIGLSDGLLRLSVGLETVDDLIADLDQALAVASETGVVRVGGAA